MRNLILAFAIGVAGPATAARAEPVRLACTLEQGQTLAYTIDQAVEVQSSLDEQEGRLARFRHAAEIRLTVREIERDGSAKLTLAFDSVLIESSAGGESLAFEWRRDAADEPEPTEASGAGMLLVKTYPTVVIDAAGRVVSISGLEPFMEEALTMGDAGLHVMGMFVPTRLAASLEPIFRADGSARVAVRETGDRWQTIRTDPLPPAGRVQLTTDWTLASAEGGRATLEGTTEVRVRESGATLTTTPSVEIKESACQTTVEWDTEAGELIRHKRDQSLTSRWTLGEQAVEQTQIVRVTIERAIGS